MDAIRSIIILDSISRIDMVMIVHHTGKNMKTIAGEIIRTADSHYRLRFDSRHRRVSSCEIESKDN